MSRSKRGEKGPWYDYWSRRPYSTHYGFGKLVKTWTVRKERRIAERKLRRETMELVNGPYDCPHEAIIEPLEKPGSFRVIFRYIDGQERKEPPSFFKWKQDHVTKVGVYTGRVMEMEIDNG